MKIVVNKSKLIRGLFALFGILFFLGAFMFTLYRIPEAITYDILPQSRKTYAANYIADKPSPQKECLYSSIYEITEDGPFTVREENGSIYVFSSEGRLYRINAKPESFPEADKSAISVGILADTKQSLIEMVQYMES